MKTETRKLYSRDVWIFLRHSICSCSCYAHSIRLTILFARY